MGISQAEAGRKAWKCFEKRQKFRVAKATVFSSIPHPSTSYVREPSLSLQKLKRVTLKLKNPSYQEVSIPKAWGRLPSLWRQVGSCSDGRGMRLGWKWKAAFASREEKLYRRW